MVLGLSSLAPPNRGPYDVTGYPTVGDVTLTQHGLSLCIKWAKNRQLPGQQLTAPLLPLSTSPACPVRLLNTLRTLREGAAPAAPLFVGGGGGGGGDRQTLLSRLPWPEPGWASCSLTWAFISMPTSFIPCVGGRATWPSDRGPQSQTYRL